MKRAALFLGPLLAACGGSKATPDAAPITRCETPIPGTNIQMQLVANVGSSALLVTAPRGDLRLFVVEQRGRVRILDTSTAPATVLPDPFIDLSADADGPVTCCGERGLLGLAFHPQYATTGTFFLTYTAANSGDPDNPGRNALVRCQVSANDPNRADAASCVDVLSIPDFASNHNGGMIEFGPDGFLYWATGDGGSANDPNGNGQALQDGQFVPNTKALLGKMLRLDVDNKANGLEYAIPADNPFVAGGGLPEIYMIGLRNAWRWTFDRMTGDMWIADVGQGQIEEVTVVPPAQQKGANLGWARFEGKNCFSPPCTGETQVEPQITHTHASGWVSITGGQVYRGGCFPDLAGTYFYTDYDTAGRLSTAKLNPDGTVTQNDLLGFPPNGASIHEDAAGELYETDTAGNIFQLVVVP